MKKITFSTINLFISAILCAQSPSIEAPSTNGINVVVTVLSIIFIGIVVYLFILDRKISKIEKLNND